ncbi:Endo-1,4-beta-xylanase Z precursor [Labilithrix luteola]|uniref:Endo-1,4-beta-xylanase Z n=1 Tax=Labilithrix luteola TaxID=1391654 RepID=A0A0K1PX84_9BACT|nr:Endo-1,4-beta-xylanase Z precursor [Labilithrix luteola]
MVAILTFSHGSRAAPIDTSGPVDHHPIHHVLATGQSLSVGANGYPALTTAQPYDNIMFAPGVIPGGEGLHKFSPLVERGLETMSSSFANLVGKMAREELHAASNLDPHDLLVSAHGVSGVGYWALKRGTKPYTIGLAQVKAGRDIAKAQGRPYVVRAITNVHGESDHVRQNLRYESDLLTWQADYERDVRAITGQREPVPMFETQMSSFTRYGAATSPIPGAQLAAHVHAPGKLILVGPKYHLPYASDGIHLTNEGYRHMGEDYAKAYRRVVLEGRTWEPVRPQRIARSGATIVVTFYVPSPPLVLDTARVSDPGNYGFEYEEAGPHAPTIRNVAVTGPDTVSVTLSAPSTDKSARLRYAFTGNAHAKAGPRTGPRGNLRDSDTTPSRSNNELFNWCVHFDEPVP